MIYTLKNGYVYLHKIERVDLLIDDGKIALIADDINEGEIIDCKGLMIAPAFIDAHSHFRDPGYLESETIYTGSRAAAKGGYSTVFMMPNTNPTISTKEDLEKINKTIEEDSVIKLYPLASITKGELGEELTDMENLDVIGFSDDGKPVLNSRLMYNAMEIAKKINKPIICHEEDLDLVNNGILNDCEFTRKHNYPINLDITETTMAVRDLVLAKKTGCHLHICHMASRETLEIVRYYKAMGVNVSVEVTPHHLILDDSMLKNDSSYKMNPPLRSPLDRESLVTALLAGDIDIISTDHAPHCEAKKTKDMISSAYGITGIETSFSLLYTNLVVNGHLPLTRLLDLMSLNVAKCFNIRTNEIIVGNHANLVIIDLDSKYVIDRETLISKGKNTPFHGMEVYGKVRKTIYKGEIIYEA